VKLWKNCEIRKTGAILHELAIADWWRALMAKIRFWAEELRHGGHLLARRVV
jgi:hypothetical protein